MNVLECSRAFDQACLNVDDKKKKEPAKVSFHSFILWSNYYDRTIITIEMEEVMEYHGSFSFTLTLVWATDYLSQDMCSNPCISPGKSDSSRTTDSCHCWTSGHIFSPRPDIGFITRTGRCISQTNI